MNASSFIEQWQKCMRLNIEFVTHPREVYPSHHDELFRMLQILYSFSITTSTQLDGRNNYEELHDNTVELYRRADSTQSHG